MKRKNLYELPITSNFGSFICNQPKFVLCTYYLEQLWELRKNSYAPLPKKAWIIASRTRRTGAGWIEFELRNKQPEGTDEMIFVADGTGKFTRDGIYLSGCFMRALRRRGLTHFWGRLEVPA